MSGTTSSAPAAPDVDGILDRAAFADDGLLPAVIQQHDTREVLMLGYMDRGALEATLSSGFATFWSRSKARLWRKGETSGDVLRVAGVWADCDEDALLVRAVPAGATCHLGSPSCFEERGPEGVGYLGKLARVVAARAAEGGEAGYTARLIAEGLPKIAQKVGEEGVEVALAAVTRDVDGCVEETADLAYHLAVLMEARGYGWTDVARVLEARHR